MPLEENLYGQFYAGDSYIVKYTYKENSKLGYMIYFWQVPFPNLILQRLHALDSPVGYPWWAD